ncbi:competence protein ComF [Geothrix rubra]|uniref:Competence protein ComF n=1 Tax=Geothrix rubra TaxID=2927977 RepID=A0ABQ5Q6V3_9BACT|nr:phosphoribosyltransferase family protein [Geothrix rubra]GLH70522.1 competence protein ComF [Geothrix rubra]
MTALRTRPGRLAGAFLLCRGCLGPLDDGAEAGLCGRCWSGLRPLAEARCPRCALVHGEEACPEATAWSLGDALWDYHGGRPALGALLLPAIKAGEAGWRRALLARAAAAPLPAWAAEADLVTAAPTAFHRRLVRGFDLAEETGRLLAGRLGRPFRALLAKAWHSGAQAARTESQRRRLPRKAVTLRGAPLGGGTVLLVDDVWTTGTTLLRCAQALRDGGADEVRVLTLFRAL